MEALGAGSGGVEAVHQQWLVLIHLRRMQERKCLMLHMPTRELFHSITNWTICLFAAVKCEAEYLKISTTCKSQNDTC